MTRIYFTVSIVCVLFAPLTAVSAPTGPNDTLFNEQGQAFFPDFPDEPGIDCAPDQVIV